ncbi:helix-turn-helix domain-containing protein [Halomonas sp. AOP43-D1-39]|uniref:helix-turn-helix domain-containing protein n=1 Tax=Halomonas sp. AOP43-D1-39 TaxID=3457659 RepID=UPI004033E3DA
MKDKDEAYKAFGQRLREIRRSKNLSQEDLSGRADLDRTYVSGCERGLRNPSLKTMIRLAKALEVDLKDLFDA